MLLFMNRLFRYPAIPFQFQFFFESRFFYSVILGEEDKAQDNFLAPVHLHLEDKRLEGLTEMSAEVFLVLSLYFFSCHAKESLLEYCGKDSYSYTPLIKGPKGQEYTLKQVHVIIR